MINAKFDPDRILGKNIIYYGRQELCGLIAKLCEYIKADVGPGVYRGGIYPENISIDENGGVALGPAKREDWKGQELDFLPPELYWNGGKAPASDVYSIGMLMYYAVMGGKLPFDGTCRDPQLRRMTGEGFEIPKEAGRRLGEIIGKATQFRPEKRYQSMDEMRVMAESCLKNLYLNGNSSAETLFSKPDDDLTEIEKLMVGIIEKEEDTPIPVEKGDLPEVQAAETAEEVIPTEELDETQLDDNEIGERIRELFELDSDELAPAEADEKGKVTQIVQYTKEAQREKQVNA